MKKKKIQNSNGIVINDDITMSVKLKKINLRKPEAVIIAVLGYFSTVFAFLGMFDFNYDKTIVFRTAIVLSLVYITLALIGKFISFISILSFAGVFAAAIWKLDLISIGYKYIYNTVYKKSCLTEIDYYKLVETGPSHEKLAVTLFFMACLWILAIIIYFCTIHKPNCIVPFLVTFPLVEIGLYNGIELPVLWGVIIVAYWVAILSMTMIDIGEQSGGTGGFVRNGNRFYPKRQMRLKVTEKCGIYLLCTVFLTSLSCISVMKLSDYHRSDELNKKRTDVKDAVSSFSVSNLAESLSNITDAFGLDINYHNHRLGNLDRIKYKDTVDLILDINQKYDGAVYLKDFTGSVYSDNEWVDLPPEKYDDSIFGYFEKSGLYPQTMPYLFNTVMGQNEYNLKITSKMKTARSFAPYGTAETADMEFLHDTDVSTKKRNENVYSYVFRPFSSLDVTEKLPESVRTVYPSDMFKNSEYEDLISELNSDYRLVSYDNFFPVNSPFQSNPVSDFSETDIIMAEIIEGLYREYVYDTYLDVPVNKNMTEVKNMFSDILKESENASAPSEKLEILDQIRERIKADTEYSLNPGRTPSNRDFINYFLLENKKGYCTHYATSGVILARMAGIPARYATGYIVVADDFNKDSAKNDGSYSIDVKDNRGHAWAEVYIDGYGWIPFEFTSGYSERTIDTTPVTEPVTEQTETTVADSENSTETKEKQSRTTGRRTTSQTHITTASSPTTVAETTEIHGYALPGFGKGGGKPVPQAVKNILFAVEIIFIALILILLRRAVILQIRKVRFQTGSYSRRMSHIYKYCEKLLAELGVPKNNMLDLEYSEKAETILGDRYFSKGEFKGFVLCALQSAFSNSSINKDELNNSRDLVKGIAEKLYSESGICKKMILKYFKVII